MYRVLASGLAITVAAAFPANASSLVTLPAAAPQTARSIVHLGEPAASVLEARDADGGVVAADEAGDDRILTLTTSVVAVGPDAIPVAHDEVASIIEEEAAQPAWIAQDFSLTMRGRIDNEATETAARTEELSTEATGSETISPQ